MGEALPEAEVAGSLGAEGPPAQGSAAGGDSLFVQAVWPVGVGEEVAKA